MIRALRRRRGWRQQDLADAASVSQSVVARAEAVHFESRALQTLRRILAALEIRLDLDARWRGGDPDRLVDARHSAILTNAAFVLDEDGWVPHQEVIYAVFRERGSIDPLGLREAELLAVVLEIKSEVTSWEETQRKLDEKVKLVPRIVQERFGWRPRMVGRVLVLDDTTTNRRCMAMLGPVVAHAYPARTREARRWLARPNVPLNGV